MMLIFRRAFEREIDELNAISFNSEMIWGFDPNYMDKFKQEYSLTKEYLKENLVWVIELNTKVIGFCAIKENNSSVAELEYFYVKARYIKKGYGKAMWNYMIDACSQLKYTELHFVTSPEASSFYLKLGAELVSTTESLLKRGRIIPELKYTIK